MHPRVLWPLPLTLLLLPSPAAADDDVEGVTLVPPAPRQGYFVGVGGGLALNTNASDEEGTIGPLIGGVVNLRLGEMVTDWLGFAFHANYAQASDARWSARFGGALLDVQLVPFDHVALHLGAGAGGLSATDHVEEQESLLGTGGGYYLVGLSYDWFPWHTPGESGGFSLTPTVQLLHLPGSTFRANIVTLGVDITWWSGLNTNRLDLPTDEAYP